MTERYDTIGQGYASSRREDPHVMHCITKALGPSKSVLNVGAGAGSYEPRDRPVLSVEPSKVMAAQRGPDRLPAIRSQADHLPFHDHSIDAVMTVLSLHHWDRQQQAGLLEMKRVARDRIVIVTIDPRVSAQMWLLADYLPEMAALDLEIFPAPETIVSWLACETEMTILPIHRDTPDGTLLSFWAHPQRVLDAAARNATSGFARQSPEVVARVVAAVEKDLKDGTWDKRYGHLRGLMSYDAGLRMITAKLRP